MNTQIRRVFCQQNGDVRLNLYDYFSIDNGIVEVFLTEAGGSSGSSSSWDIVTITCKNNSYSCLKSCSSVPLYNQYCPNYKITCNEYFNLNNLTLLLHMTL